MNSTTGTDEQWRVFLTYLKEQLTTYRALMAMTADDRKCIERGDMDDLREALTRKNALLDSILERDQRMSTHKERWQTYRTTAPEPLRSDIAFIVSELKLVIEDLVKAQKENEGLLEQHTATYRHELSTVRKGKAATRAYGSYAPSVPVTRYMDKTT